MDNARTFDNNNNVSRVAGMLSRNHTPVDAEAAAKQWSWEDLLKFVASGDEPVEAELDYQEELDKLVGEADKIRERAIQLMAMPFVDADALRWMVDGNERHGGEHFTKATWKEMKHLKGNMLAVYLHVKRVEGTDSGWCKDSPKEIAGGLKVAERTVERMLPDLVKINALHKEDTKVEWIDGKPVQKPHWYRTNPFEYWRI